MPDKLQNLLRNMKSLNKDVVMSDMINNAIRANEDQIIELNTRKQIYDKGIRSDGAKIKLFGKNYEIYSRGYTRHKRSKGLYRGKVDLNYSGDYLASYEIQYFLNKIEIEPSAAQADLGAILRDMYGEEIEGLTPENLEKMAKIITPNLRKQLLNYLKNGNN